MYDAVMLGHQTINELDLVRIPQELASAEGVEARGTVVWYVSPAPTATVECVSLSDPIDRLETKLLDISISDLEPIDCEMQRPAG
jgi:hypothetical protein